MTTSAADTWRDVSKRIGFYTKETAGSIPAASGCYAWFLPLWIYDNELPSFFDRVSQALNFDPESNGVPKTSAKAQFNWEEIRVDLERHPRNRPTVARAKHWNESVGEPDLREALQQTLMEASLFMPPLYVGKANNLEERYAQHVTGRGGTEQNSFHQRFTQHAKSIQLPVAVSDLLFVCIVAPPELSILFREHDLNELIEHVLMRLCRPAFSIK